MCVDFDEIECASGDNHITMKIALTMAIGVSFRICGNRTDGNSSGRWLTMGAVSPKFQQLPTPTPAAQIRPCN